MTTPPNILIVMADQLAASWLPAYGQVVVQAPNLTALSADGVTFDAAYCASPLCAPSRASLLTGLLPSRTGVFDNASEMAASMPTVVHRLRAAGYATTLVGKMHFVGPDQLHGFEERLTPDIYPAGLEWTPDWRAPAGEHLAWYHTMQSVLDPAVVPAAMQADYDDEVAFHATRALFDHARHRRGDPLLLVASFTNPHDPWELPRALVGPLRPRGDRAAGRRADSARAGRSPQPPAARDVRRRRRGPHRGAGPARAPRVLRRDQLRRRAHRPGAARAA